MVRTRASLLILLAVALGARAAGPGRPLSRWSGGVGLSAQRQSGLAAPTLLATQPSGGSQRYMLELRGGAKKKDKSKKNKKGKKGIAIDVESEAEDAETPVDVEDDEFNVAADEDGFEDSGVNQGDFDGENTFARQMQSAIEKTPPVTQAFLTLSIGATLASFALNNNRFPDFLLLDWAQVVTRGQIWRLFTAFLYFGPLDISFALTVQFVWQYMSQLEKVHHKEPEQFVMMWLCGASFLLAAFAASGIPTANLGHNLSCFLVYVWSRTYEGHEINFMELFTMRSELMPWFLALQTFLLEGEFPLMDLVGIAAGHVYYVLYSTKRLWVPGFLKSAFRNNAYLQKRYEAVGADFAMEGG